MEVLVTIIRTCVVGLILMSLLKRDEKGYQMDLRKRGIRYANIS